MYLFILLPTLLQNVFTEILQCILTFSQQACYFYTHASEQSDLFWMSFQRSAFQTSEPIWTQTDGSIINGVAYAFVKDKSYITVQLNPVVY